MKQTFSSINMAILGVVVLVAIALIALGTSIGFGASYSETYNRILVDGSNAATEIVVDIAPRLLESDS